MIVVSHDWAKSYRGWAEDLQWTPEQCQRLTVGQWWAVFVQFKKAEPVDWDKLRERRNVQRAKAGKPPIKPGA